jgi:hypothetical protein
MRWIFPLIALSLPALAVAQNKCPWLNQATAGGELGGEVTSTSIDLSKAGDTGHCDFVRSEGSISRHLFIEVDKFDPGSYKRQCSAQTQPLKAIGNEAVACTFEGKSGEIAEQVASRVRDQMFLVRFSTSDRTATAAPLREKARKIAEQVAGFLF